MRGDRYGEVIKVGVRVLVRMDRSGQEVSFNRDDVKVIA